MVTPKDSLQSLIKELSDFIETLGVDEITPSESISINPMGKVPFAISSIDEAKIQSSDNMIILEGENWYRINDFKKRFYKVLSKRKNFSNDYIDKIIWRAIALRIRIERKEKADYNTCAELLSKLFNESTKTFNVFIEIEGFYLSDKEVIKFGKTKFYLMTESKIRELLKNQGLTTKEDYYKSEVEYYKNKYLNKLYSETITEANDNKAAVEKANIYLNRMMNIINFFSGVYKIYDLYSGFLRRPGKSGNPEFVHTHTFTKSYPKKAQTYSSIEHQYDIHYDVLKKHLPLGKALRIVETVLLKDETNSLFERILTSLQWAGIALWEKKKEIAFTNYITALEALLLLDSHTELSYRLNLYASFIVGKNFKSRTEIFNKLKSLYEIRSKIVHTGVYEIDDDDLNSLKFLVINVVLAILLEKKYIRCGSIDNFKEMMKEIVLK